MENKYISLPRPELVQTADAVAREKNIDREEVFGAMEDAIAKAARAKYGYERDLRVNIDRKIGSISVMMYIEVMADDVEIPEEEGLRKIHFKEAKKKNPDIKVGEFVIDYLPPIEFGRMASQTAKQVIVQKVRDAERQKQYEEFKGKVGEIVSGIVRRVEYGNAYIDIAGRAEGVIQRNEMIPRENLHTGDRVRAYVMEVKPETRGAQIFLSRTHPQFMAKLFAQEVPEIYDGVIEIKAVARDPGSRAKIAVYTKDSSMDPVGACVGMRGTRVQSVVGELQGEKIDVIQWSPDMATFIVHALAPADVAKVVLDEEDKRIEVVVPDDQLSLAIGRRGQNVRLASMLTNWHIDVLTEKEESEKRQSEFKTKSALFIEALDVDEMIAQLLVTEGFGSVEEIAMVPLQELGGIEGFDEDLAKEMQMRAKTFLEQKTEKLEKKIKELGVKTDLLKLEGLTLEMILKLAEKGLKTKDDLADLAGDELVEMLGRNLISQEVADTIIMKARADWFKD